MSPGSQNIESRTASVMPTVCIVDDDESVGRSLSRLIRAAGWQVKACSCANDFMAQVVLPGVACVVLDIRMPGLTGPQLHEWMRSAGISLPVIFLTGHGDVPTSVQAIKRGAIDFLMKPVDEDVLLEAIRHAVGVHENARASEQRLREIMQRHACLTAREREVMGHVIGGRLNKQIAADLGISEKTVKVHRARAIKKMGARSVVSLVHICNLAGIAQACVPA